MNLPSADSILARLRTAGIDAAYLLLGLPIGVLAFSVAVTGLSLAAGLAITLVGIPVLLGMLLLGRWFARFERLRAGVVLDTPIPARERPIEGPFWQRVKATLLDPGGWLGLLWALLILPLGILGFTAAVTAWSAALGLVTSPIWYWALPDDGDPTIAVVDDMGIGYAALRVVIGLALIPLAYLICRALALGIAELTRLLLGRGRSKSPAAAPHAALSM